ncbi:MAG TPA: hypothetical protein VFH24_01440, partial [Gemmatimonadales bacterium]|nr:hypothetical protein [Gemmatimonadales bacterium]
MRRLWIDEGYRAIAAKRLVAQLEPWDRNRPRREPLSGGALMTEPSRDPAIRGKTIQFKWTE